MPRQLRARFRDLPRVVWVVCRAFTASRRPGRMGGLWALSSSSVHLPSMTAAVVGGRVAVSADRTAVVAVTSGRADAAVLLAVGCVWIVIVTAVVSLAADVLFSIAAEHGGPLVTYLAAGLLAVLVIAPLAIEMTAITRQRRRSSDESAERYTARLRRLGLTVWAVGPWAAWPPHRGAGRMLIDEVLPMVPDHVWLVAKADNYGVAARLRSRGFLRPSGGDLLFVRPAARSGDIPPAAQSSRRGGRRRDDGAPDGRGAADDGGGDSG